MAGKTLAASQVKVATGSASRECCPSETLAANRSSSQVKVAIVLKLFKRGEKEKAAVAH
jgi:hypothetical protein